MVGGGIALHQSEVLLSMSRMNQILQFNGVRFMPLLCAATW